MIKADIHDILLSAKLSFCFHETFFNRFDELMIFPSDIDAEVKFFIFPEKSDVMRFTSHKRHGNKSNGF